VSLKNGVILPLDEIDKIFSLDNILCWFALVVRVVVLMVVGLMVVVSSVSASIVQRKNIVHELLSLLLLIVAVGGVPAVAGCLYRRRRRRLLHGRYALLCWIDKRHTGLRSGASILCRREIGRCIDLVVRHGRHGRHGRRFASCGLVMRSRSRNASNAPYLTCGF